MEEFDEMVNRLRKETEAKIASASMVFWIAEIEKYEKYDYSLNCETEASEYFQDEANAKAWLLEAQTEIAPLDQWVDGKYEDDYSGIYMPFIYQLRTKD